MLDLSVQLQDAKGICVKRRSNICRRRAAFMRMRRIERLAKQPLTVIVHRRTLFLVLSKPQTLNKKISRLIGENMKRLVKIVIFTLSNFIFIQTLSAETFKSLPTGTPMKSYIEGQAAMTQDISYEMHFPKNGKVPVPAVIIAHGSGGVNDGINQWKEFFLKRGYAVAIPDSFKNRISGNVLENQAKVHAYLQVVDVAILAGVLKANTSIDPTRIISIGFSRGGMAALNSAFTAFYKPALGNQEPFAAHVSLYPACNYPYMASTFSKAPVLVLMGEKDDFTPSEFCVAALTKNKQAGMNVSWYVYPGGYHGFDASSAAKYLPKAEITARCPNRFELNLEKWEFVSIDGGEVLKPQNAFAQQRACAGKYFGAWYGATPGSVEWSFKSVGEFLSRHRL